MTLLVYIPAYVAAGMDIETVGVMVNIPIPVFAVALKNSTGVAPAAAGTPSPVDEMVLCGSVHLAPGLQDTASELMIEAEVDSVCIGLEAPVLN